MSCPYTESDILETSFWITWITLLVSFNLPIEDFSDLGANIEPVFTLVDSVSILVLILEFLGLFFKPLTGVESLDTNVLILVSLVFGLNLVSFTQSLRSSPLKPAAYASL